MATSFYLAYLAIVRPFKYLIQNIAVIINQTVTVLVTFMFIGFMGDNASEKSGLAKACASLFSISIVLTTLVGFTFQGYLLHTKLSNPELQKISAIKDAKETENKLSRSENQKEESERQLEDQTNLDNRSNLGLKDEEEKKEDNKK